MGSFKKNLFITTLMVSAGFGCFAVLLKTLNVPFQGDLLIIPAAVIGIPAAFWPVFRLFRYRGDISLYSAVVILLVTGFIFQVRLSVLPESRLQVLKQAEFSADGDSADGQHIQAPVRKIGVTYLAGLGVFLLYTVYFIKKDLSFFKYKYFLLIGLHSVLLLMLYGVSKILGGRTFLFSRTPWELSKLIFPFIFAGYLSENISFFRRNLRSLPFPSVYGWGPFALITILPACIYILIGDFGQLLIYGGVFILLLYGITRNFWYLVFGVLLVIIIPLCVKLSSPVLPEYALQRWEIWWDFWGGFPSAGWWNRNYQIMNGIFSILSGGFFGTGLGLGFPNLVPLVRSDFVFVGLAEEFGFAGIGFILSVYIYILLKGMRIASEAGNLFMQILAMSVVIMLGVQIFLNIGGVIGIVPLTGITLPFLSRGGSSLMVSLLLISTLMVVSHHSSSGKSSVFYKRI